MNDLERRLTDALDSKAEQLVPARRVPPPLDLDRAPVRSLHPHRARRIWLGSGLLVAAAALVVAALAVGTDVFSVGQRGVTPPAQETTAAPVTTSPSAPVTTGPTSAPATTGSTAAPGPTTHSVTLAGVTLQVPASWQVAPDDPNSSLRCVTLGGVAQQSSDGGYTNTCEVSVDVGDASLGQPDPDALGVFGNGPSSCKVTTVTADQVTVDGQSAEHRVFTGTCFSGTREQWTVLTTPVVVLGRDVADAPDSDVAAASAAVAGARLPTRTSSMRVYDIGYARTASTSTLALDRVTLEYGHSPVVHDVNPETYPYAVGGIDSVGTPDGTIPMAQYVDMVRSGDFSSVGITGNALTVITTDGHTVTSVGVRQAY